MPVVPPQFRERLQILQRGVPPKPLAEVKEIIEKSMGRKFEGMFRTFEEVPIGSASVGQVNRPRGEEVEGFNWRNCWRRASARNGMGELGRLRT